VIVVSQVLE